MDYALEQLLNSADPRDLWTLYDAPYTKSFVKPETFASFARSKSTEALFCTSASGLLSFRANGPQGGRVAMTTEPANLDSQIRAEIIEAFDEAASRVPVKDDCLHRIR